VAKKVLVQECMYEQLFIPSLGAIKQGQVWVMNPSGAVTVVQLPPAD